MNNEELKKKIAQIIADYFCLQRNEHKSLWGDDRLCYSKMNFAECERVTECTDALIAAGIGDVKEAEHRTFVMQLALKNACEIVFSQEIDDEDWDDVIFNYKKEKGIREIGITPNILYDYLKEQAEKELAEENSGKKKI